MLNEKKINKSGSITIPSHLRRQLGIESGENMKIELVNNGQILLTRIIGSCIFCSSNENLVKVKDKYVCKACMDNIRGKENEKN